MRAGMICIHRTTLRISPGAEALTGSCVSSGLFSLLMLKWLFSMAYYPLPSVASSRNHWPLHEAVKVGSEDTRPLYTCGCCWKLGDFFQVTWILLIRHRSLGLKSTTKMHCKFPLRVLSPLLISSVDVWTFVYLHVRICLCLHFEVLISCFI